VVVSTRRPGDIAAAAVMAEIDITGLGTAGGDRLVVEGLLDIPLSDLVEARKASFAGVLDPA